jgi:hypothetical protein
VAAETQDILASVANVDPPKTGVAGTIEGKDVPGRAKFFKKSVALLT